MNEGKIWDTTEKNIPIAPNFPFQLLRQLDEILLPQLRQPWVRQHHAPSHNRRDLPIQVQALAQIEQRRKIALAERPGRVVALLLLLLALAVDAAMVVPGLRA